VAVAAAAAGTSRRRVPAVLAALGCGAVVTAALAPGAVLPLVAGAVAVLAAAAGQGVLGLFATEQLDGRQRPAGAGLFHLCCGLGGAVGPALAARLLL
jgi:hypothetical protein